MIEILLGTDRPDSKSSAIAAVVHGLFKTQGVASQVLDLRSVMVGLQQGAQYGDVKNPVLVEALDRILKSKGMVIVVPEYNGSYPGALKYFIDHWKYPDSFEFRPIAFIGLGGRFGGLRPVEHLQQVFGYRNAHIYPERVFIMNVWDHFKKTDSNPEGRFIEPNHMVLLERQARGFAKFVDEIATGRSQK